MSSQSAANGEEVKPQVRWADLLQLTKPRITLMVVLTAGIGALLGGRGELPPLVLLHALLGTALVSGGASALNQVMERETDARMRRTAGRPIPAGRLSLEVAWVFSLTISLVGLVYLGVAVNGLSALLGSGSPVELRAPLHAAQATELAVDLVGAVPGAIPPMMGWAAVSGRLEPGAWVLFGILFFWQLPHFFAIAWLLRDEYGEAGFPMLPVIDADGRRTGRQMILYSLALLPVSLMPTQLGLTGKAYLVGAALLGVLLLAFSIDFARSRNRAAARRLMRFSIVYLPAILIVMVLDRAL